MTEFEMAYLVTDMQIAMTTSSATLFSITSAFLVASYFSAHRLTAPMIAILIAVYAWSFFGTTFVLNREFVSLFGLTGQIHAYAEAGKGLAWHAAAHPAPGWLLEAGLAVGVGVNFVIFVSTLVFFFHCRRVNRKAEAGGWKPKG